MAFNSFHIKLAIADIPEDLLVSEVSGVESQELATSALGASQPYTWC